MAADDAPLSPNERRILAAIADGEERDVEAIAAAAGLAPDQVRSAIEGLKARGAVEQTGEEVERRAVATALGRRYAETALPELALLRLVGDGGAEVAACQRVPGFEPRALGAALGRLRKAGLLAIEGGRVRRTDRAATEIEEEQRALESLAGAGEAGLGWEELPASFRTRHAPRKRGGGEGLVEIRESVRRRYRVTERGRARAGEARDATDAPALLTREMLKTGAWREVLATTGFRPYHIGASSLPIVGRRDPYREFLDAVKLRLLALGFEEMRGSLVETEFWDMDALFLPQFHPAREIHDVYFVDDGRGGYARQRELDEREGKAIDAVAAEHEGRGRSGSRGWGYRFDRERTLRLVLRSQGTVLSARWLARPDLRVPGKYFAMARCFRYDTVDATHAPDFFQVEGIVVSERTSFRHLLGLLELFAVEIARAEEIRFVPAYFPFTEPSVEIHVRHPDLGWMELGGAGIFRPEVTMPHGVETPVIAWGLGLDRMAMVALGIRDIRELFTNNAPGGLQALRERGRA